MKKKINKTNLKKKRVFLSVVLIMLNIIYF